MMAEKCITESRSKYLYDLQWSMWLAVYASRALQLSPFWRCNILPKYFATFSKKGLQKTDRLTFRSYILNMNGDSYRLDHSKNGA